MTLIVKMITRLTVGLILIYGIYIVLRGHTSPGGGFAGGVIVALSFIHLILAFGKEHILAKIDENKGILAASLAAVVFLTTAAYGFGGRHSPALAILYDIALAVMVGVGLFLVFLVLVFSTEERAKV